MPRNGTGFRDAMDWLHTWFGVVLAAVLFAVFWMGSLSVFDREIDRWMIPETRLPASPGDISYDRLLQSALTRTGDSPYLNFVAPDAREPSVRLYYETAAKTFEVLHLDPRSGQVIDVTDSLAGTGFIFPFHFGLHIGWADLGYWIVGFAALSMLLLLISGLFIHRKIISEFFVFRPTKNPRRALLDLHNLTSLIGLPFYFLITFSGLLIFAFLYFPWAGAEPFDGDAARLYAETSGAFEPAPRTGEAAALGSIDAMKASAEAMWSARVDGPVEADIVRVINHGDASAAVYFRSTFPRHRVILSEHVAVFDGASGELLSDFRAGPVRRVSAWIEGAHFVQFGHWPLRWLYFLAGLSGCAMIALGQLFWLHARTDRSGADPAKVRVVRALTVGAVTGLILATAAFFLVNRLLPAPASWLGLDRAGLEVAVFACVWILSFVHAALRGRAAWSDQAYAIAALASLAVLLNWASTGDHLVATATQGLWSVLGMDVVLLTGAIAAATAALRLERERRATAPEGAIVRSARRGAQRIAPGTTQQ